MGTDSARPLHQSFLPASGKSRAFVWKYSEINKGRRPRHFHAEPELNLVVAGQATFGVGRARVQVSAGQLIGFPPGQDHVLLDASPDVYLYSIGVEPTLAAEATPILPLRSQLATAELEVLTQRCTDIVDREQVDGLGTELWLRAQWLQSRATNGAVHVLTRRALTELARSPDSNREQLSRVLRASPSDVSRYFHRDVGVTLVQYRTRARLLRLIELFDAGERNLKELARRVGFGSYSQCHRAFQAELGCAPSEFFASGVRDAMQQAYALK